MDMGEFDVPGVNFSAAVDAAEARARRKAKSARLAAMAAKAAEEAAPVSPPPATPDGEQQPQGDGGGGEAGMDRQGSGGIGAGRPHVRRPSSSDRQSRQKDADALPRQRLRVYSVLPPCLAERARVWRGHLAVKEGWRQTDRGFFDAPGATFASGVGNLDAGDGGTALGYELMPPVTVVFASVEGAKGLLRWRRGGESHSVAHLLRLTMLAALDAVPGGYLCREQEGELKYMLAFSSAGRALQWCLLVQEAAMFAPWPAAVLAMPEYSEVHAPGDGTLLFRGPRLKMGACEGVPRGILCDHVGRVDYHGASVNQAARYMDAAAHGGQVVCDAGLAEGVFRWVGFCGHFGCWVGGEGGGFGGCWYRGLLPTAVCLAGPGRLTNRYLRSTKTGSGAPQTAARAARAPTMRRAPCQRSASAPPAHPPPRPPPPPPAGTARRPSWRPPRAATLRPAAHPAAAGGRPRPRRPSTASVRGWGWW
jgi:hypothetical protein